MKKITKISFLLLALGLFFSAQGLAQEKLAYVNPDPILLKLPERIKADEAVEAFGKNLDAQITTKLEALKKKEEELYAEIDKGLLSQKQIQERMKVLQTEYEGITKFEEKANNDVQQKRVDLYTPIYDKLKTAIEEEARAGGFTMVIDGSIGALLHADEVTNLTPAVAKKLGIPVE